MNYIGSKYKLAGFIEQSMEEVVGSLHGLIMAELFGGTGIISRKLKTRLKQLIVNDLEPYSYALLRHYIGNTTHLERQDKLIEELRQVPAHEGLIYQHYCEGSGSGRMYFSNENGQRIDGIRTQIEAWKNEGYINEPEYYFLLASLLENADKVANTASVYGAFLKQLKRSAQNPLNLRAAAYEVVPTQQNQVYNADANELIKQPGITGDILYLDPPYNARQYGANYHLLNTIVLYDVFEPRGKTGLRDYNRSLYCQSRKVAPAFEELIAQARFRYIFVSYNNEGLMSKERVREIMSRYGHYSLKTIDYQRFKADKTENRNHKAVATKEYLHILVKK
ncbi:DNA adenine methylase [Microscilla marina]|uniref:site-specific DNA-methyltransferase (adenine-specific) n=1 Tax=Microscilla marina ATCC 23134 TaxID=313606 RepID=A1ZCY5_MICM2|nr:DNA adenine methylase [Microscilla marina]EAY31524.1 modification methylase NlaIII [Microscilla marina ATCC 23134]